MAAIVRALSDASGTLSDGEILTIAVFGGIGLTISLLLAVFGLDLGAGLF